MPYRKPDSDKVRKTVLNDKPRRKGQGTHRVHLIDTPEYQAKIERIYEYIKQGMRSNEIFAMMIVEDEKLTEKAFIELLRNAYIFAENALHKDRDYVFQLHMDRYEKVYEKNMVMVNSWNQPLDRRKDWAIMCAKYINALNALISKEKLLGLHDKSVSLEFNEQQVTLTDEQTDRGSIPGYDIEKLTLAEQKELLTLIKEARTVPIEGIQRVTIKKTVIEINTETGDRTVNDEQETIDIGFEDMPAPVVHKFENIPDPEDEPQPEMGPIVIDNTPKVKPKEADDVKESINKQMIDKFKEKLKEKRNR